MVKKKPDQLCWNCKRAVNCESLTCPWAARGEPIDGWKAEESEFRDRMGSDVKVIKTYCITECPLFIQDRIEEKSVYTLWPNGETWY